MQPPTLSGTTPDTFAQKCILSPCESVYSQHAKEYTLRTRKSIHFHLLRVYTSAYEVYTLPDPESILSAPQSVGGLGQEGGAGRQGGAGIAFQGGVWHNDRQVENQPSGLKLWRMPYYTKVYMPFAGGI